MGDLEREKIDTARQAKLDAVLLLEKECCVSRGNLYRFLAREEIYTQMLQYVIEQVAAGHVPSVWQTGVLCDRIRAMAEEILFLFDIRTRSARRVSRTRRHGVLNVGQTPEEYLNPQAYGYQVLDLASEAKDIGRRRSKAPEDLNLWAFDYSQFLVDYCLKAKVSGRRPSGLLDNGVLVELFSEAVERDLPYLVHSRLGRQFSFREAAGLLPNGMHENQETVRALFKSGHGSYKRALIRSEKKRQRLEKETLHELQVLSESDFPRTFELERALKYNFCEIYDYAFYRRHLGSPAMQRKAALAFLICYADARPKRRALEWDALITDAVFWIDHWAKRFIARHRLKGRLVGSATEALVGYLDRASQSRLLPRLQEASPSMVYALAYVFRLLKDEKHGDWLKAAFENFRSLH